jgi:hypothetical protein
MMRGVEVMILCCGWCREYEWMDSCSSCVGVVKCEEDNCTY